MARACTVCTHPARASIDEALVSGEAYRAVADRHGVSGPAVYRHQAHIPASLAKAKEAAEVADADNLLRQVRVLQGQALGILKRAQDAGDLRTALTAIREARGNIELLAKLTGELDERATVNVLVAPEWLSIRAVIVRALDSYPDARDAVVQALEGAERGR